MRPASLPRLARGYSPKFRAELFEERGQNGADREMARSQRPSCGDRRLASKAARCRDAVYGEEGRVGVDQIEPDRRAIGLIRS
jgi:hypothetical protein